MERLQKVIAQAGVASRRKAEELIVNGKVTVNGSIVRELGTKVSGTDIITVNGRQLTKESYEYYLLNKPRGYICSLNDEFNRNIVTELIATDKRIYPVGRLDYDTTGLIILTNDGDFANMLMHPSYEIEKTYVAKINKILDKDDINKLKKGIVIDNRKVDIKRFKIRKKDVEKNTSIIELTIVEGRNHIVKKIFESMRIDVIKLSRVSYAFLTLDGLKSGEYRKLSIKEIKKLYALKKC